MSRNASEDQTTTRIASKPQLAKLQISLIDRTAPKDQYSTPSSIRDRNTDTEQSDSEQTPATPKLQRVLSKKLTNTSLQDNVRQQINRQKYARYQAYRYAPHIDEQLAAPTSGEGSDLERAESSKPQGLVERSRARTAALLRGKKKLAKEDERTAVLDILYENQRGAFFFGVPRFGSRSLLQIDAKPWQNADFRTSAVDIRNAQVPDPSWEWAWNCWYVDMSRDVDEQGWEYSFAFGNQFNWHGNHPWFYSFVRRRRWLRKRVRKDREHKTKERGHELTPDYFTIHSKVLSASSQTERGKWNSMGDLEEDKLDNVEVTDVAALLQHMRYARLDREKLVAMRAFMKSGGVDDIQFLSKRMGEVMSLFIYQSSRRQLLAELVQQHEHTNQLHDELAQHDHEDEATKAKHELEKRRSDSILEAVHAADRQIQKLEYWSDIRDMTRKGETLSKEKEQEWDTRRWQGLNMSHNVKPLASKQDVHEQVEPLHDKPEQQSKRSKNSNETDSSDYTTASSITTPPLPPAHSNKRPSVEFRKDVTDSTLERFVTASEGPVSSIKPKQYQNKSLRGKARDKTLKLDGVHEEEERHTADEAEEATDVKAGEEGDDSNLQLHEVTAEDSRID